MLNSNILQRSIESLFGKIRSLAYYLTFIHQLVEKLKENSIDHLRFEVRSIEIVNSTNDYVSNLLRYYRRVVALSLTQTAGRGRDGKSWASPPGGLWLSMGIRKDMSIIELSSPVVEVVNKVLSKYVDCAIKPPNDIIFKDLKLAGILVEGKIIGDLLEQVVIGIGVNVKNEIPEDLMNIATRLSDYTEPPAVEALAAEISLEVIKKLDELNLL